MLFWVVVVVAGADMTSHSSFRVLVAKARRVNQGALNVSSDVTGDPTHAHDWVRWPVMLNKLLFFWRNACSMCSPNLHNAVTNDVPATASAHSSFSSKDLVLLAAVGRAGWMVAVACRWRSWCPKWPRHWRWLYLQSLTGRLRLDHVGLLWRWRHRNHRCHVSHLPIWLWVVFWVVSGSFPRCFKGHSRAFEFRVSSQLCFSALHFSAGATVLTLPPESSIAHPQAVPLPLQSRNQSILHPKSQKTNPTKHKQPVLPFTWVAKISAVTCRCAPRRTCPEPAQAACAQASKSPHEHARRNGWKSSPFWGAHVHPKTYIIRVHSGDQRGGFGWFTFVCVAFALFTSRSRRASFHPTDQNFPLLPHIAGRCVCASLLRISSGWGCVGCTCGRPMAVIEASRMAGSRANHMAAKSSGPRSNSPGMGREEASRGAWGSNPRMGGQDAAAWAAEATTTQPNDCRITGHRDQCSMWSWTRGRGNLACRPANQRPSTDTQIPLKRPH